MVDICIIGLDCVVVNGDVCNKIGMYLKVFVVDDNNILFYVVILFLMIDWILFYGVGKVLIEEWDLKEVIYMIGLIVNGYVEIF